MYVKVLCHRVGNGITRTVVVLHLLNTTRSSLNAAFLSPLFFKTCNDYAGAVAGLTRAVTSAAAPRLPLAPILIHQDARQPISTPSSRTTAGFVMTMACANGTDKAEDSAVFGGRVRVRSSEDEPGDDCGGRDNRDNMSNISGREGIPGHWDVDAVLTSPPYPGVYDYLGHARYARSQLGTLPRSVLPADAAGHHSSDGAVPSSDNGLDKAPDDIHSTTGGRGRGESLYIDSPVPSGRDWPSEWTRGEIGAKSQVRRRRRGAASRNPKSESLLEGVPIEEGGEEPGVGAVGLLTAKWIEDQRAWLDVATSSLKRRGRMVVMIGDGEGIDTRSCLLGDVVSRTGGEGLGVLGWVTFRAADTARRSMRTEHLILLEKS